jgi:ribosomal protein S18 acetylase RimI-like enzyme
MPESISAAANPGDYEAFAELIREYVDWLRGRYREHPGFVEQVFGHQGLDQELQTLSSGYGPPNGLTLLVRDNGAILGAGAYRRLSDGSCEMKRLFVPERFRGRGIGRRLAGALIDAARTAGFDSMRLDSGRLLTEAIALYRELGFRDCAPYAEYPEPLLPHLVFMDVRLRS